MGVRLQCEWHALWIANCIAIGCSESAVGREAKLPFRYTEDPRVRSRRKSPCRDGDVERFPVVWTLPANDRPRPLDDGIVENESLSPASGAT